MRRIRILLLVCSWAACVARAGAAAPDTEALVRRARDLFECGQWSDARHEFLRARAALLPSDGMLSQEVAFYLAACAVELGSPDAEGALRAFETRYPESVFANDVRFALGSFYCAEGDLQRAREAFERTDYKALSVSRREQYDIRMGYVEFTDGRYDRAYERFERIDGRSEYADHACYYKAYIDYAQGRYGRAKEGFKALLRSDAYRDVAPYYLLQIEFREGNYRYVVEQGDALAARAVPERRVELERVIAESWFRLEDFDRTLEHLDAFARSGGAMGREVCYLKGFSLYRTARYAEAAEWLRKACGAEDALTQNASYHLADCCLRLGDKEQAMRAFAMASDETWDAAIAEDALFNYAKLQYELGGEALSGAIHVLTRYLERYPASPRAAEARTLLIAAYYNSRDYDAAYRAIRAMPSDDVQVRAALQKIAYFRALEAFERGDLEEAQRCLDESAAVPVSRKYAALNGFWQGEIAFARGDYAAAAARYSDYLKQAPRTEREYALAWYNLGYCAFDRKEMKQAGAAFDRFLSVYASRDSYRADALNRLGDVAYADRRFEEAVAQYDRSIAIEGPQKRYAQYKRAVVLGILGRTEQKQQALRQIATAGGDYADEASYELGRSCIAQERYAEGASWLERFLEAYPASPRRTQAYSDLGLAYLNLGDKRKSIECYDRVVEASPHSVEAQGAMQNIRDIYVSEGDAEAYFDYAARVGMESDLTAVSRDSLSFAAAQKLYLGGQHEVAAKSLRSYIKSYPKGYYITDVLYYLSDCYLHTGERERAIETLSALADRGTSRYSLSVLEQLSCMTFEDKRWDEAATAYRRLYDATQTRTERANALLGYVRATVAGGDDAKIAAMVEDVCSRPDAGAAALREAKYARVKQLRAAGRKDEALDFCRDLAQEVRTREGSEAAYYLVEAAFERGELERTEAEVFALSEREPQPYWLAKAFILLGDVYLSKGDSFQARATWQSVVDGYSPDNDGIVAEARARIAKLN